MASLDFGDVGLFFTLVAKEVGKGVEDFAEVTDDFTFFELEPDTLLDAALIVF
jgi:hypothetical protein